MSSVYNNEPPTTASVLIRTTHGELSLELWAKECPRTVRNFLQLCVDGVYTDVIFHRIVAGQLIQTGDPTGAGTGAEDIYGGAEDFASGKEFNARIRFTRRGQVAMAGPRGSQFFVSLNAAEHLTGKHVIFGKLTGDSIFTAARIGELETDKADRPTADPPPRITGVDVILNPFDDIVPRQGSRALARAATTAARGAAAAAAVPRRAGVRAPNLLSFGNDGNDDYDDNEGGGDGGGGARRGVISLHEATLKAPLASLAAPAKSGTSAPVLSRAAAAARDALDSPVLSRAAAAARDALDSEEEALDDGGARISTADTSAGAGAGAGAGTGAAARVAVGVAAAGVRSGGAGGFSDLLSQVRAAQARTAQAASSGGGGGGGGTQQSTGAGAPATALDRLRAAAGTARGARSKAGEAATLERWNLFQAKLKAVKATGGGDVATGTSTSAVESYHGQVLEMDSDDDAEEKRSGGRVDGDADGEGGLAWARGSLKFVKHVDDNHKGVLALGGANNANDGLVTVDPLRGGAPGGGGAGADGPPGSKRARNW